MKDVIHEGPPESVEGGRDCPWEQNTDINKAKGRVS